MTTNATALDQTVQQWLAVGIPPIPAGYKSKGADVAWRRYQHELPGLQDLGLWFAGGQHNMALITGHQGLTVIDFDNEDIYSEWKEWAGHKRGMAKQVLTAGYTVKTSRGRHIYVTLPHATRTRSLRRDGEKVGIDIKSRGGYVLAPPSVHPSGALYEYTGGAIFHVQALADVLPRDLLVDTEHQASKLREKVALSQKVDDPWEAALLPTPTLPGGTVERIKSHYCLEDFLEGAKPSGNGWAMALCPFHDDNEPSFSINTERQTGKCLAGCTPKPLDIINLYAWLHDLSNTEAIHMLAKAL